MTDHLCECGCGEQTKQVPYTRGRYPKGTWPRFIQGHHMRLGTYRQAAKLDEREVAQIKRRLRERRMTHLQIGRRYGVSKGCISSISRGQSWVHVEAA